MADVWDVYADLSGRAPESLTHAQRAIVAVCDLRQEVNSGGFDNYFRAWGGNSANAALRALPAALGQEWADLLTKAMAVFGSDFPADPDVRSDVLDELSEDVLEQLDDCYYVLEGAVDADARLNEYLDANPV